MTNQNSSTPSNPRQPKAKKPTQAQLEMLSVLAYPGAYISSTYRYSVQPSMMVPGAQDIKTVTINAVVSTHPEWFLRSIVGQYTESGLVLTDIAISIVEDYWKTQGKDRTVEQYRSSILASIAEKKALDAEYRKSTIVEIVSHAQTRYITNEPTGLYTHTLTMGALRSTEVAVTERERSYRLEAEYVVSINVHHYGNDISVDDIPNLIKLLQAAQPIARAREIALGIRVDPDNDYAWQHDHNDYPRESEVR